MSRLQHGCVYLSVLFRLSTSRRSSGWNPADPLRGDGVLHQALNRGGYQYNAADPRITGRKGLVHTGLQPHRLGDQVLCPVYFMFVCSLFVFWGFLSWPSHFFQMLLKNFKYPICSVVRGYLFFWLSCWDNSLFKVPAAVWEFSRCVFRCQQM